MLQEYWQNLPLHIDPIAFSVGSFLIYWYSLMYLVGFAVVYGLLRYRIKKDYGDSQSAVSNSDKKNNKSQSPIANHQLPDLMLYLIIGLLIGARFGYVFFYDFGYYSKNILEIFLPFQLTDYGLRVTGYFGMSYHGGLIGVILAGILFVWRRQGLTLDKPGASPRSNLWNSFLQLADFVVPAIPAGYFFGRIGNFLNGELYGRATDMSWGMYFPADPFILRHPSQLYEALFEGLVLFLILWFLRNKIKPPSPSGGGIEGEGVMLFAYLFLYSLFRFFIEFLREPDPQIGYILDWITLGQTFSIILVILSLFLCYNLNRINRPNS